MAAAKDTRRMFRSLLAMLWLLGMSGCAGLTRDFTGALLENPDPETVASGLPAYLLILDGIIQNDPDDEDKLMAGAELYSAYAGIFVQDRERARRLTARARQYAETAMCEYRKKLCGLPKLPFEIYRKRLALMEEQHLSFLYGFASTWAGWVQAHSDSWEAIAELPKVKAALERIIEIDDTYRNGQVHLYLGVIGSLLPPALGGKPEEGRTHFERALEITHGLDLLVKVEYARRYARLVYDRALHDRLLKEVLEAPVIAPGLTLSNTLAQRAAQELLKTADQYF
jgi:hypothetical protein